MPVYEYICPTCEDKFELLRPISKAGEDVSCPSGHQGAKRAISVFASFSMGEDGAPTPMSDGGGCACGGACSCGA